MDASELAEVLHLHALWWKGDPAGKRADLSGANLSGANLLGANLSRANLSGANLSGADLLGANLSRVDLLGANLSRANLSGANLLGANLSRANLSGANLSGANLSRAYLSRADLSGADLSRADLSRADLSGADLSGANLLAVAGSPLPGLYLLKLQPTETKVRAWKYLENGASPYQHATYAVGRTYSVKEYSEDERILCDKGLNVATLDWCLADSLDKVAVEFLEVEFKAGDIIAVPLATDGKFRVRKLKVLRKITREQAQVVLNKQLAPLLQLAKKETV